ncbi:pentatricopeptide repeat-containing protein at1g50270 [Phtheirospermum japonicum]|uniref:Pentatricopeptide repeat-containing protein at1g50270 n=1 Tax=Phtheirospermum japonicum TaxID=374723 RepID=A0A830D460_9LAMI|nr:pentatricopeptide repeat-containing protein at1g50270 [Phtheirospermum japonicum]
MSTCPVPTNLNLVLRYLSQQFHHHHFKAKNSTELPKLQQIHSLIIVSGLSHNSSFLTRILLHCLSLSSFPRAYAFSIFSQIPNPNAFTYNALIRAFSFHPQNAAFFYAKMRRDGVFPNKHTFPLLLKSKTQIPFQIFAQSIKFGFGSDPFLSNSLLSAFASLGLVEHARQLFDEMPHRDVVAYSALMDVYVKNSHPSRALDLFLEMRASGLPVDEVAVVTTLCAVGTLGLVRLGESIHGFYVETGRVARDVYIGSALVDMYSKFGCCEDALRAFRETPHKNLVSWAALLSGYVQRKKFQDALHLFREMLAEKIEPSETILASVLSACAHLGSLEQGRWVDNYIINKNKLKLSSVLGTALIDMYAKCGCADEAFRVFERMRIKDVYPWTALIFGFAINGDAKRALDLFSRMLSSGVGPNEVTFIAVLSACSHGGLVDEGRRLFESMEGVYGVKPNVDHYGCMVDLLGRAGRLGEAVELIGEMPMEPSAGVWGALFGGCMIHKEFEVGAIVGKHLIELQPGRGGRYARLANLYSRCRDWEAAADVRRRMNEVRVEKAPGCSWIESDGVVREFVAFGELRGESGSVHGVVDELTAQMKRLSFVLEDDVVGL